MSLNLDLYPLGDRFRPSYGPSRSIDIHRALVATVQLYRPGCLILCAARLARSPSHHRGFDTQADRPGARRAAAAAPQRGAVAQTPRRAGGAARRAADGAGKWA